MPVQDQGPTCMARARAKWSIIGTELREWEEIDR